MATAAPTVEVSRGAAFNLVTIMALGLAYHPAYGSLIFGPTSRFWVLSPLSSILDAIAVVLRLGECWAVHRLGRYFYSSTTETSNSFGFRDQAYAILVARCLNATEKRRAALARVWELPSEDYRPELVMEVFEDVCKGVK
jgi:hypothetical protein